MGPRQVPWVGNEVDEAWLHPQSPQEMGLSRQGLLSIPNPEWQGAGGRERDPGPLAPRCNTTDTSSHLNPQKPRSAGVSLPI